MLHNQKIVLVSIVDNNNCVVPDMKYRVWHYQKFISKLLKTENCLMGRKTYDLNEWKGPNSWVITQNRNWRRSGVGTIHDLDDIHLFSEGPVYVLGGNSLHHQLKSYVDEMHLYVLNNESGQEPWIKFNMRDWKPLSYTNKSVWSYANLERCNNFDPHNLNEDLIYNK